MAAVRKDSTNDQHTSALNMKNVLPGLALTMLLLISSQLFALSPDLSLEGLDGKDHDMSEYIGNGKWVVLNIWGPRCPPCVEEMPDLQNFADDNKDHAIVVGLALDYPSFGYAKKEEVATFIDDYFVDFPILLGDAAIAGKFVGGRLAGTPTTLLYEPGGKLVARQLGMVTKELIENFIRDYEKEQAGG